MEADLPAVRETTNNVERVIARSASGAIEAEIAATNSAMFLPAAQASPDLLRAYYERARRVSDKYGRYGDLAPESNYATILNEQFRFEQIIDVLQPIVDFYPDELKARPNCLAL